MKDIFITILYWILNSIILVGGLIYAYDVWHEKRKAIYGIILFFGGVIWHIIRGINEYKQGLCTNLEENNAWLSIANKCVPHMDYDIILAQLAIFTGLFVLIALVTKRYYGNES
jgi:hypothetical protein